MPQVSLYVDRETLTKIEAAAAKEKISISRWVAEQIREKLEPSYPAGFEDLYGSVRDEDLTRQDLPDPSLDSPREGL